MVSDARSKPARTAPAVLVFLVAYVLLALAMDHSLSVYDEGLILVDAMRVGAGEVPHRDFYANYGPAQFYVLAALFKLFGSSILVERAWDTAVRAGLACLAYLIVRAVGSRREAFVAAGLVGIWLLALGNPAVPIFPALFFCLVALLCLMPTLTARGSVPTLFGAGLSLGVTLLFRYDVGIAAVAALSAVAAARELSRPAPFGQRVGLCCRHLAVLLAGLAVVCVPLVVVYVGFGVTKDFVADIIDYPAKYYWRMRARPFPTLKLLAEGPLDVGVYVPMVVWATALIALLARRGGRAASLTAREWIVVTLVILSMIFYLKGLVRVGLLQMALSLLPSLIAAVLFVPWLSGSTPAPAPRPVGAALAVAFVVLILPSVVALKAVAEGLAHGVAWALRSSTWTPTDAGPAAALASCRPPPDLARLACFSIDPTEADAVRYVGAHSRPNDTIFVGLDRHDRMFANDNIFYFLAARRPATKYSHFDPGLQTRADIQSIMIGELSAKTPPVILLDSGFDNSNEPNDSGVSSGVRLLDTFLRDAYRPVKTFGSLTVMEPKVRPPG